MFPILNSMPDASNRSSSWLIYVYTCSLYKSVLYNGRETFNVWVVARIKSYNILHCQWCGSNPFMGKSLLNISYPLLQQEEGQTKTRGVVYSWYWPRTQVTLTIEIIHLFPTLQNTVGSRDLQRSCDCCSRLQRLDWVLNS